MINVAFAISFLLRHHLVPSSVTCTFKTNQQKPLPLFLRGKTNRHFQTAKSGLSQGFVTGTCIAVAGSADSAAISSVLLKDGSRKQIRPAVFNRHYQDCRLAGLWIKASAKPKTRLTPKPPLHLLFSAFVLVCLKSRVFPGQVPGS